MRRGHRSDERGHENRYNRTGTTDDDRFRAKNLDTPDYIKFRVEGTREGQEEVTVVDAGAGTVHKHSVGRWTDLSAQFSTFFSQFQPLLSFCHANCQDGQVERLPPPIQPQESP